MRCGTIAKKIGMTRVFDNTGKSIPVSVLSLENCQVIAQKTEDKDGYSALQVGSGSGNTKRLSKALRGHFAKSQVEPKSKIAEFKVSSDALLDVGSQIGANHYVSGQKVDVVGISKGKGFAGSMKRHNFRGMRASHGVSISHRAHGSTGQCQDPGKVFKGKKMAGHMGDARVTTQNLSIIEVKKQENLILICGSVPGSKGGYVYIRDSIKSKLHDDAPFPAGLIKSDAQIFTEQEIDKNDLEKNKSSTANVEVKSEKEIINTDQDVESKDLKESALDSNKNIDSEDKGQ